MATTVTEQSHPHRGTVRIYEWNIEDGETGDPIVVPVHADVTVQMSGTFDGGTVTLQGALDSGSSPVWATLTDPAGNDVSLTAAGIRTVMENTYKLRPTETGGGTSLAVKIVVMVKA